VDWGFFVCLFFGFRRARCNTMNETSGGRVEGGGVVLGIIASTCTRTR